MCHFKDVIQVQSSACIMCILLNCFLQGCPPLQMPLRTPVCELPFWSISNNFNAFLFMWHGLARAAQKIRETLTTTNFYRGSQSINRQGGGKCNCKERKTPWPLWTSCLSSTSCTQYMDALNSYLGTYMKDFSFLFFSPPTQVIINSASNILSFHRRCWWRWEFPEFIYRDCLHP